MHQQIILLKTCTVYDLSISQTLLRFILKVYIDRKYQSGENTEKIIIQIF